MFKNNPEEFITKVIRLINEQKAAMIVEHISYDTIEGEYDSAIFTAEKNTPSFGKAFLAKKAIQDYEFTDGSAEKSIERKFVEKIDLADEVCVYAKLPRTIEQVKISCAKKLFNEMSTSKVKYHDVDSYQSLLNLMESIK